LISITITFSIASITAIAIAIAIVIIISISISISISIAISIGCSISIMTLFFSDRLLFYHHSAHVHENRAPAASLTYSASTLRAFEAKCEGFQHGIVITTASTSSSVDYIALLGWNSTRSMRAWLQALIAQ
jgi:hypothetical protein